MSLVGYGRVSTADQNTDAQRDALTTAGCERFFLDTASGKLARRPQLDAALDFLRPGDTLVITKLDRLGRSVRNLVDLAATLAQRGVDLRVLDQGIDTSTSGGKLTFHILGAIAEFERDLISERTRDGLQAARARGRKGGRRPKMTPGKLATAQALYDGKAHTMAQIAEIVGVSRATVYRHLEPAPPTPPGTTTIRLPPMAQERPVMEEYLGTVSYAPELPEGWPLDEHGLPIIAPHPDEDPDELL